MSRVGKQPVIIPGGVKVKIGSGDVSVSGPKGDLQMSLPPFVDARFDEKAKQVTVTREVDTKQGRANHGLTRSLIANMVEGVTSGFQKRLLIFGTGYNTKLEGKILHLNVGFMGRNRGHGSQFELPVPEGIEVVVEAPAARGDNDPAKILIRGADKQAVGQFAAEVRAIRKTEPYKGKGIRYEDEQVKRKQGKTQAGS